MSAKAFVDQASEVPHAHPPIGKVSQGLSFSLQTCLQDTQTEKNFRHVESAPTLSAEISAACLARRSNLKLHLRR